MRLSTISALLVGVFASAAFATGPTDSSDVIQPEWLEERQHARDLAVREPKTVVSKAASAVKLATNVVQSTSTTSIDIVDLSSGVALYIWTSSSPVTLIGAHMNSTFITDGVAKVKTQLGNQKVDHIVLYVAKNKQGDADKTAVEKELSAFTKTKTKVSEYDSGKTWHFWAKPGNKGEVSKKEVKKGKN